MCKNRLFSLHCLRVELSEEYRRSKKWLNQKKLLKSNLMKRKLDLNEKIISGDVKNSEKRLRLDERKGQSEDE